jgi:chromate reductase
MSEPSRPIRIVVLCGTNRPGAQTRRLAAHVHASYAAVEGVEAQLLDLADLPLELLAPGSYAQKPAGFQAFAEAVLKADGLVVLSPEYNGSFPGVLKLFIDMLPFPVAFERRPVAFIGLAAGRWGALRAIEQLQGVFGYRNAFMFPNRVFVPGVGDALDAEGGPKDGVTRAMIAAQVRDFVVFARQLAPLRPGQA